MGMTWEPRHKEDNPADNYVCAPPDYEGNMCLNGGVCISVTNQVTGAVGTTCSCKTGTAGAHCEQEDACDLTCKHGGSCREYKDISHSNAGSDFYECECVGPYKGKECEIPVTTCPTIDRGDQSKPALECLWGGRCVAASLHDYVCVCPESRTGEFCGASKGGELAEAAAKAWAEEVSLMGTCHADHTFCKNGGRCVSLHDAETTAATGVRTEKAQCLCALGWGGDACELACVSLDCQHGSSCRFAAETDVAHAHDALDSGAYCDCAHDGLFKGLECEIAVQKCPDGIECLYGGACVAENAYDASYACICPRGRMGPRCETKDPDYRGGDGVSQTSSSSMSEEGGINPILFIASVFSLALLVLLPVTVMIVKRSNQRNAADAPRFAAEGGEGKGTAHASSEEGFGDRGGRLPEDAEVL